MRRIDRYQNKRIKSLDRKIKKIQRSEELKYFDTDIPASAIPPGLSPLPGVVNIRELALIPAGDQQNQREGAQINATSLQYRLIFTTNLLAVPNYEPLRMIIFWDKQVNGSTPSITGDPIGTGSSALLNSGTGTQDLLMPYQHENLQRFKILEDRYIQLHTLGADNAAGADVLLDKYVVLTNKIKLSRTIYYDGPGAATANLVTNGLFVTFISSASEYQKWSVSGTFRLYFKEGSI